MSDIANKQDIKLLVDTFYNKLSKSELLKDIFFDRLGPDNWQPHLERIYDFWETVLLGATSYVGQSFAPHATMNLHKAHFDEWLLLFTETTDELFVGEVADDAKKRANTMAILFLSKIDYNRNGGMQSIV
jgi:hemoglobin